MADREVKLRDHPMTHILRATLGLSRVTITIPVEFSSGSIRGVANQDQHRHQHLEQTIVENNTMPGSIESSLGPRVIK